MIVVAIVGILATIALPSYFDYVTRGRITEATTGLSDLRQRYEQYFLDIRSYAGACAIYAPQVQALMPTNGGSQDFALTCAETASTYVLTATGQGNMAGFVYTLDNTGAKQTTGVPTAAWGATPIACWVVRKGGQCE